MKQKQKTGIVPSKDKSLYAVKLAWHCSLAPRARGPEGQGPGAPPLRGGTRRECPHAKLQGDQAWPTHPRSLFEGLWPRARRPRQPLGTGAHAVKQDESHSKPYQKSAHVRGGLLVAAPAPEASSRNKSRRREAPPEKSTRRRDHLKPQVCSETLCKDQL